MIERSETLGEMSLKTLAGGCAQEFTLHFASGSETIFVRTRTQAEIEAAQISTAEERLKIQQSYEPGNTLYESLICELRQDSEVSLVSMIITHEWSELMVQARTSIKTLIPFDPSMYRTEADREKARKKHEQLAEAQREEFDAKVRELVEKRREQLMTMPHETLVEMAIRPRVQIAIQYESNRLYHDCLIMDCIRCADDHSKSYFEDASEVPTLAAVRGLLLDAISHVEQVGAVEIKNSQGRSVASIGPAASTPEPTKDPSTRGSRASRSHKK